MTEKDVFEMRKLAASGILQKEIAEKFKIGLGHVSDIINRKSWKHI